MVRSQAWWESSCFSCSSRVAGFLNYLPVDYALHAAGFCIFHLHPAVQAFLGSQSTADMFIYPCHGGKEVSQRLRRGFRVLKRDAWPSFTRECEPNNLKEGYNGATFINLWSGTILLCLHACACFFKSAL